MRQIDFCLHFEIHKKLIMYASLGYITPDHSSLEATVTDKKFPRHKAS